MNVPIQILNLAKVLNNSGGKTLLVGGCVRDSLLGLEPKDWDIEVFGLDTEKLKQELSKFGEVIEVGESFGVLKITIGGLDLDVATPRREVKTGSLHTDFEVVVDPFMPIEEALSRRDFTFNAIAFDPITGETFDPFGGTQDLLCKRLHPTSERFKEDPLRVLRGMQFAGRFGLHMSQEFIKMSREIKSEFSSLSGERVWGEFSKWARQSVEPSKGLKLLRDTGWIEHFPEIDNLIGCLQSAEWHPEGDAFVHTCHVCDAMVELDFFKEASAEDKEILMISALSHDFGKPSCTEIQECGKITSYGHEAAGAAPTREFLNRMKSPKIVARRVIPIVKDHMALRDLKGELPTKRQIQRLARRLSPSTIEELCCVMDADKNGRPPLPKGRTVAVDNILEVAKEISLEKQPPTPWVSGRDLIALGMVPNPDMGKLLKVLFDKQVNDQLKNREEAIDFAETQIK